jgi:hypothetical protein
MKMIWSLRSREKISYWRSPREVCSTTHGISVTVYLRRKSRPAKAGSGAGVGSTIAVTYSFILSRDGGAVGEKRPLGAGGIK